MLIKYSSWFGEKGWKRYLLVLGDWKSSHNWSMFFVVSRWNQSISQSFRESINAFVDQSVSYPAICMSVHHSVRICVSQSVSISVKIQTHKRLKRTLFIMTEHNMWIFGVSPFSSYKTTLKQQSNGEKLDVGYIVSYSVSDLVCWIISQWISKKHVG